MTDLSGCTNNGDESAASDFDYADELGSSPFPLPQSLALTGRYSNGDGGEVNCWKPSRKMSVKELKIRRSEIGSTFADPNEERRSRVAALWQMAYSKVLQQGDPWEKFHLESLPMEIAKRHRYSAVSCQWVEDIVRVKLDSKSFSRGAMRECFRAKKLSNFSHIDDWLHASNFVAKRYIEPVDRQVYFDDVRLQMDAKLWGEEFSRQPAIARKVDIAQMCVLEFIHRPENPVYHLEHFIEGTYRKYNSNSGFVDDVARNTPQAFSHFTFEQSGHRLIVVDIQGVGDLWTDPQIHTVDGKAYGDGNLGVRGMALFFHTHRCNPLCTALELGVFDLLPGEQGASGLLSHLNRPQSPPPPLTLSLLYPLSGGDDVVYGGDGSELTPESPGFVQFAFGATEANPRHDRYGRHQRLTSYNHRHQGVSESGFIDADDFCEPHSLPSDNGSQHQHIYHPLRFISSPSGFAGDSPLIVAGGSRSSSTASSSSAALHRPDTRCPHRRRRRTGVCNGVEKSYDSGVFLPSNNNNGATPAQRFFPASSMVMVAGSGVDDSTCSPSCLGQERRRHLISGSSSGDGGVGGSLLIDNSGVQRGSDCLPVGDDRKGGSNRARFNFSSASSARSKHEAELMKMIAAHRAGHRSSSVGGLHISDAGILGLIHHELARLHACGRFAPSAERQGHPSVQHESKTPQPFSEQGLDALAALHALKNINWEAAVFHEEQAAVLQCPDAIECMAQYYLDLPISGPLAECPIRPDPSEAPLRGLSLISTAATSGDRSAMLFLAEVFYSGRSIVFTSAAAEGEQQSGGGGPRDWLAAVHWYDAASRVLDEESDDDGGDGDAEREGEVEVRVTMSNSSSSEEEGDGDLDFGQRRDRRMGKRKQRRSPDIRRLHVFNNLSDWPVYKIHGRLGEMYARGGHGLEKDTVKAYELFESAADGATEARQGRLAMYYYDQAALYECEEA